MTPSVYQHISVQFDSQEGGESSPKTDRRGPGRPRLPEGPKDIQAWRSRFKKDLLEKQEGRCADCHQRKGLELHKIHKGSDPTKASGYALLCPACARKRKGQPKSKSGQRRHIKRTLLEKLGRKYRGLYMCPGCLERKKLRLYRVHKGHDPLRQSDYILSCRDCIRKRVENHKKARLWTRKPGKKKGISKTAMFASIRPSVFERDGKECPYCGSKENLGLGALLPLSRGGKLCFDNYTVICQKCRGAKSGSQHRRAMTPLEFIWSEITLDYWLHEQLDDGVTVKNPGATARLNVHFIGEIAEFCARVTVDERVPPEHRKKAEFIHIRLSQSDEDKRRERTAEKTNVGGWIA